MSVFDRFLPANQKFFADLRTGGVKHYDYDPLVEVYKLRDNVFSILSLSPGMGGDAWMHLVIGPERAMLIDTGFGIGDLKALAPTCPAEGNCETGWRRATAWNTHRGGSDCY